MLTNDTRSAYGREGVQAGSPDAFGSMLAGDTETAVVDTIANILHFCEDEVIDFRVCLASAQISFQAERFGDEI